MRPNHLVRSVIVLAVGLCSCRPEPVSSPQIDTALACIEPNAIRAHIRFLSDDLLEGREAGTRGFDLAAKYVASTLETMGLEPAGIDGTFFQNVPLRTSVVDFEQSSVVLFRQGWEKRLSMGGDFIPAADFQREDERVRAPLVFIGYGITAPELNHDDYAGLEVKGKIAVVLFGAPASFPNDQRAYYSGRPKLDNAVAHGAVGLLTILSPSDAKRVPWEMVATRAKIPSMRWLDESGNPTPTWPELRGGGLLSQQVAEEIFSYAPTPLSEVFSQLDDGTLRGFDIPVEVEIRTVSRIGEAQSPNVVTKLEGTDPELRNEYVVYSAHLDHDGIMEFLEGDNIFNGAYDNASGTAVLLEIGRAFQCLPEPPRRSILFLGTTAEEKGLLGADYFARHPTVPRESMVANLNVDGVLMLYPIRDIVVYGAEHSSLGDTFQQAADELGLSISPDPMPEEVIFIRSDQFPFVQQGIPAAFPMVGLESGDPQIDGATATRTWMTTIYHTPRDDFSQEMDLETGAIYARVSFLAGYLVAQSSERPTWNEGDFFGNRFAGQGQASR